MNYLCLCTYDQKKFAEMSKDALEALGRACRPHDEALRRTGQLILVGSLALPPSSRTLRPGRGRPAVSEGPLVESGEPVGAFFIIEASDMDEAIEVASKHPGAHLGAFGGAIEVRPIDRLDQPERTGSAG